MNTPNISGLCPWVDETLSLLLKVPRQVKMTEVAKAASVPETWLCKFQANKFKSPNIIYVYRLNKYLINSTLITNV